MVSEIKNIIAEIRNNRKEFKVEKCLKSKAKRQCDEKQKKDKKI